MSTGFNSGLIMQIKVIDTLEEYESLRQQWQRIYAGDPYAHYFLSFDFLRDWLAEIGSGWLILAARKSEHSDYSAFLPLRLRTHALPDGRFTTTLLMAGNYGADYTGMISRPQDARHVIPSFAKTLRNMAWNELNLDYVQSADRRYHTLLQLFPRRGFETAAGTRKNRDGIDNLVCPVVQLPGDWDQYLAGLSANIRQKLRRLLRALDGGAEFSIVFPTEDDLEDYYAQLAQFWLLKWQGRKGPERARSIIQTNYRMTLNAFRAGTLYMPLLHADGRLVAGLITFLDSGKRTANFFMTGRDESYGGPSPGLLLHAYSMRDLIGQGYRSYDFLRGDEPYKLLYGPELRGLECFRVTRLGRKGALDRGAIPNALRLATSSHMAGRLKQAAAGYTQILSAAPDNLDALYRYGQLLEQISRTQDACKIYRRALRISPKNRKLIDKVRQLIGSQSASPEATGNRSR